MGFWDDISGNDWVNLGGSLLNSWMQSNAAKDALAPQIAGANKANDMTWQMYQQTRQDQMPWLRQGGAAVDRLGYFLGLGNPDGYNPKAAQQQDTIPAKITPKEAVLLKSAGGAGVQNPKTGVWHFYTDVNAERASRWGGSDVEGLAAGKYDNGGGNDYGIDAGEGGWGWDWKRGAAGFLKGGMPGLAAGIHRTPGSPEINGGGWDLGPYGGSVNPDRYIERKDHGEGWGDTFGAPAAASSQPASSTGATYTNGTAPANGTAPTSGFGSWMEDFGANNLYDDPGYQFRINEANKALQRSAAAKGNLLSGGMLKELSDLNQNLASQEYGNAWNRYQTNRGNKFNMLSTVAGLGQNTAGTLGGYGLNTAANMGNNWANMGNAQAASALAQSNAWTGGINNALNYWNYYKQ